MTLMTRRATIPATNVTVRTRGILACIPDLGLTGRPCAPRGQGGVFDDWDEVDRYFHPPSGYSKHADVGRDFCATQCALRRECAAAALKHGLTSGVIAGVFVPERNRGEARAELVRIAGHTTTSKEN